MTPQEVDLEAISKIDGVLFGLDERIVTQEYALKRIRQILFERKQKCLEGMETARKNLSAALGG